MTKESSPLCEGLTNASPAEVQFQDTQLSLNPSPPPDNPPPEAPMMIQATSSRVFARSRLDPMVLGILCAKAWIKASIDSRLLRVLVDFGSQEEITNGRRSRSGVPAFLGSEDVSLGPGMELTCIRSTAGRDSESAQSCYIYFQGPRNHGDSLPPNSRLAKLATSCSKGAPCRHDLVTTIALEANCRVENDVIVKNSSHAEALEAASPRMRRELEV